jgi:branched-chain amino acid transport system ATP-binding protein
MLQVKNIEVSYIKVIQVLRGVSLEVQEGKIAALLGANGAGKTTTLKAISGMLKTEEGEVTGGRIEFDGKRIDGYGPETIAAMGISQAMEGRRVLEHLSVEKTCSVKTSAGKTGPESRKTWNWSSIIFRRSDFSVNAPAATSQAGNSRCS